MSAAPHASPAAQRRRRRPAARRRRAPLVELRGVSKRFVKALDVAGDASAKLRRDRARGVVHAVDRVDLAVAPGEVVGLVGESGLRQVDIGAACGRSFAAQRWRAAAGRASRSAARRRRGHAPLQLKMQMIFQDPYASLNPRMRVLDIVGEAPVAHRLIGPSSASSTSA
jgi:peptide/nickel transport system ATP-binding protein